MAKLYFRYGAMGSSKTANALMVRYNYMERGMKVILLKPRLDRRDGERIVHSRIGLDAPCDYVEDFIEMAEKNWTAPDDCKDYSAVIIDEAQFMTSSQVDFMAHVVDDLNLPVICYGLRTDPHGLLVREKGPFQRQNHRKYHGAHRRAGFPRRKRELCCSLPEAFYVRKVPPGVNRRDGSSGKPAEPPLLYGIYD